MPKIVNILSLILTFSASVLVLQPLAFGETSHMLDFPIGLKIGESADIDSELKMTLLDMEDSRCPSDVQCVWQGTVTAKIKLENKTQDLGIHSISLTAAVEENEKTYNGHYIRLTNVNPHPQSTNTINPADYVLTFFVSESDVKQADPPIKQLKKGIPVNEIQCNDDLVLMIKKNGLTPSCVSYPTSEKLISRGWGELAKIQIIQPIIKTGTDAGFCLGYCSKEFVITDEKITYTSSGRYSGIDSSDHPEITKEIPFSNDDWNNLVALVDFEEFRLLPNKIGCPGCADAPVEWIEITHGDEIKKIEFERGDEIPEIKEIVLALQAIRNPIESTLESFEECVAAGNPVMESYPRQCRTDDGKSFVEKINSFFSVESQCKKHDGEWLLEWNECEYLAEQQCLEMNGDYFECESACRHDPNAEICTTQCVPVCVIS